jgi:serine protease Do
MLSGVSMAQGNFLEDIAAKYGNSVAIITYTVDIETGPRTVAGQGICIRMDGGIGTFLTTALDPRMETKQLKDFQVTPSAADSKPLKAKLLGIDAWTGLGFVQATEKAEFTVVQFSATSKVKLGQPVGSVGVLTGDPAHPIQVGMGYVGSILRVPGDLVYVSSGNLTGACSPVYASDGRAIGIIGQQLFLGYQTPTQQGLAPLQLRNTQETSFFTPVEEFVHVLKSIPSDGQTSKLAWIGVNRFEAVGDELAGILNLKEPAVKVDEVIPDQPGAKAGLQDRDLIVQMNGQPIEKLATPQLVVQNFARTLMRMPDGTKVVLKVLRAGQPKEISVTMGAMPTRPDAAERYFNKAIGVLVREKVMLDEYLDKSDTAKVPGLIVMGIVKDSPSAVANLHPGDVITNVNNNPVKSKETFSQIVEKSLSTDPRQPINFLVRRGTENPQVIVVKPAQ